MEKKPLRILLVDDDEMDRNLFIDAFEELKMGTNVHTVNDANELMEYLTNHGDSLPHFIFLDLKMPRKGGVECLKEIRANAKFKAISIAIYSTSASQSDIDDTFHNGANVYITKPNDFNLLKQVLAKAVSAASLYQTPQFNIENFLLKI
jgi:CheY-like chemotaxis protein